MGIALRTMLILAAIAAVVAILVASGCSQKAQQKAPDATQTQTQEAQAPTQAHQTQISEQQPTVPAPAAPENEIYRDGSDQSLDELSQLE